MTIGTASLAIVADDLGKFFGEADPLLSYVITDGALVGSDTVSGSLTRIPGEDVGVYAIEQGDFSAGSNYLITFTAGVFTIIAADIQVLADEVSKVYGEEDPALTFTVVDGSPEEIELITGELSREPGEDVGSYVIVQGDLTGGDNLNLSFVGDTFTISQAPLELTADDLSKSYGEDDPSLTYSITVGSLAEGDTIAGKPERDSGEITGTYAIDVGDLDAGTNYNMSFIGGQFTVDKAVLTVTADDQSKLYGEENPSLSYSYSGFAFEEDETVLDTLPLISTVADHTSEAGDYPIILSGGADNNYSFMLVEGVLHIQKTTLTLTAEDKERAYGEENPEFTFTITGFVNGEDFSVIDTLPLGSTSADLTTDAGSYPIIFSGGFDNKYDFSYIDGTLLIQKAIQVISFEDIPEGLRMTEEYSLIASSNAGLPVSFSSSDMTVAAVDGDLLTILMAESVTITAFNEGNQNWYPAEAAQDIITLATFDNITSLFTPNGDGINDFWYIPHMAKMGRVQVQVFNRYGNLVYESDEYSNDWDGQWKNKALPEGAYYYIMETELSGLIKGVVNIVR